MTLQWAPFELRPGMPEEGQPVDPSRSRYGPEYREQLRQKFAECGITMASGERTLTPNPQKAQEAAELAKEQGRFEEFHRAVFRAHFEESRNIGDVAVLAEIGHACGLDADALVKALAERRYAGKVAEQVAWARQFGVTAIPTFVFANKLALVGAQEYPLFQSVMERLGIQPRQPLPEQG